MNRGGAHFSKRTELWASNEWFSPKVVYDMITFIIHDIHESYDHFFIFIHIVWKVITFL